MQAGWLNDLSKAICRGGRGLRVNVSEGQSSRGGAVLRKGWGI